MKQISTSTFFFLLTFVQQIINATWRLETNEVERLSRWIRCLFSLTLTCKIDLAEHLLDQVTEIVVNSSKVIPIPYLARPYLCLCWRNYFEQIGQVAKPYPAEELEWLATTTFNKAVDFYCASQNVECRCWAEKALNIANLMADGGTLHALLQTKFMGLTWDHSGT